LAKKLTYYDQLGVARNAPDEVITGAYKALARKNHPDKNIGNSAATNIMQELNRAYDVLSDPGKRADYDARLNQQEMAATAKAERVMQRSSSQYSGAQYSGSSMQASPMRSGRNVLSVIFMLGAAIFLIAFVYLSNDFSFVRPPLPVSSAIPAPVLPVKPAETFVPRETTPQELAVCIFAAAKTYAVPPALLLSLLSVEGGAVGKKTSAPDHSEDLGLMQINSSWVPELAKAWEVSPETARHRVLDDACINVGLGAWILQTSLNSKNGDMRGSIALYHTSAHHLDPKAENKEYTDKAIKLMELYKPIHGPEDLLGQTAPPANK
jgi:soluble lytic murein transglycosylase-like protein